MAYLPLVLLLMAASFSGFAVLSIIIANRSNREQKNTIFPIVREMEGLRARWARLSAIVLSVISALSIGGWVATQSDIFIPSMPELSQDVVQGSIALVAAVVSGPDEPVSPPTELVARVASPEATATAVALIEALSTPPDSTNAVTENIAPVQPDASIAANEIVLNEITSSADAELFTIDTPEVAPISPAVIEAVVAPEPASEAQPEPEVIDLAPEVFDRFIPTGRGGPIEPPHVPDNFDDINIGPIVFATGVTDRRLAVDPKDVFDGAADRIYAVFPYKGMQNGTEFSVIWYYQGQEISREDTRWTWGSTDRSFAFITPAGAGNYEVEMQVNSETLAIASFEIQP